MSTHLRLFTSICMVLCLGSQAALIQGQTFQKVRYLTAVGDKTKEIKAHLVLSEDSLQVRQEKGGRLLQEIPYSEIESTTYSRSKHPRWKTGIAAGLALGLLAVPFFFMKGKKHWLTFETGGEDHMALRLDKKNFESILYAVESKGGLKIERFIED